MFSYATLSWDRAPFSLGGRFRVTWHPATTASCRSASGEILAGNPPSRTSRAAYDSKRTAQIARLWSTPPRRVCGTRASNHRTTLVIYVRCAKASSNPRITAPVSRVRAQARFSVGRTASMHGRTPTLASAASGTTASHRYACRHALSRYILCCTDDARGDERDG